MSDLMNNLFGPLGKGYCIYFYALSIIFLITFAITTFSIIMVVVQKPKTIDSKFLFKSALIVLYTLIPYLVNRLLYTMCVNSVN
jgi:hypothetical protein